MKFNDRRTKIISTIGPSSQSEKIIEELILAGANIFRLNFSHGSHEIHEQSIKNIRAVAKSLQTEVAILADLQGPKIRIDELDTEIKVEKGDSVVIGSDPMRKNKSVIPTSYSNFAKDVKPGERLLIDDGLIEMEVTKILNEFDVQCLVKQGGLIKSRKGMNLPDSSLSVASSTEKDIDDLKFISTQNVDFIALSFVRTANDIVKFKDYMRDLNCLIPIIAKIEKPEAIKNINEIITVCYGIMIARGDLGVEIPAEQVPFEQKRIVKLCNKRGKPVVIATQILESMVTKAVPTRAEVNDIANAVLDGADCLMLSAETASGQFPVKSVETMNRIIKTVEEQYFNKTWHEEPIAYSEGNSSTAMCYAAVHTAIRLNVKAIACVTLKGNTALKLSQFHPTMIILAATASVETKRKLLLSRSIHAIVVPPINDSHTSIDEVVQAIDDFEYLEKNDLVLFVAGLPNFSSDSTNTIRLLSIKKSKNAFFG